MNNVELGAAWSEFCRRLEGVGASLLTEAGYPTDALDVAEGFRHLARDTVYALQWYLEYRDPRFPQFHRYMDLATNWGGPCVDFNYLRARVDADYQYRVTGSVAGVRAISISLAEGEMHLEQYGVYGQLGLADIETGPDGRFELLLAAERPEGHTGNFLRLDAGTDHLLVRLMFGDWCEDALPALRIERLGSEGHAPDRPSPALGVSQLDEAIAWVEASLPYWNRYTTERNAGLPTNELRLPANTAGGAPAFQYAGGTFDLPGDDDALVVEIPVTESPYWSIHYYVRHWFEAPDFANRHVSLTGQSAHADGDGVARVVFAHRDPGVPNWIDTEHRRQGNIAVRFTFLDRQAPALRTRRTTVGELRSLLPAEHPVCTPEARVAQQRRRREGFARRFRS